MQTHILTVTAKAIRQIKTIRENKGLAQWSGGSGWMTVLLTGITTALVFGMVVGNAYGTRRALEA
ncbi:MAG: hypothetical protein V3T14_06220 [Myxococcota bacterium]